VFWRRSLYRRRFTGPGAVTWAVLVLTVFDRHLLSKWLRFLALRRTWTTTVLGIVSLMFRRRSCRHRILPLSQMLVPDLCITLAVSTVDRDRRSLIGVAASASCPFSRVDQASHCASLVRAASRFLANLRRLVSDSPRSGGFPGREAGGVARNIG
jgi:hypothetical protein